MCEEDHVAMLCFPEEYMDLVQNDEVRLRDDHDTNTSDAQDSNAIAEVGDDEHLPRWRVQEDTCVRQLR